MKLIIIHWTLIPLASNKQQFEELSDASIDIYYTLLMDTNNII